MKLIKKEFIFGEPLPTSECHASTIAVLEDGTAVAAWFGGTKEGAADVLIWYSRRENGIWSRPEAIPSKDVVTHWNPVLYQTAPDTLSLYYKKGPQIPYWQTMVTTSHDFGCRWSEPTALVPDDTTGGRGPVKNKPITLSDGALLAPASTEQGKWRCFADRFDGQVWTKCPIPVNPAESDTFGVIQPTLWESENGCVHALMRSNMEKIYRSDSQDLGKTWCAAYPTELPNNNSGIDLTVTADRTLVLVCNPVGEDWGPRTPLTVYTSRDNGMTFEKALDLETEAGEFSYPATVCRGNRVYITYTYQRKTIAFCELEME